MDTLHEVITDYCTLSSGYLLRQDYMFSAFLQSDVYDAIVIRSPIDCRCWSPTMYGYSRHSLEEHIAFINAHKLEKAIIIAEDIRFLQQCPTLKYFRIIPADTAPSNFDYSPLYDLPEVRYLDCRTAYGGMSEPFSTTICYDKVHGLRSFRATGKGHLNYNHVDTLEEIRIYENKEHRDLTTVSCSSELKRLDFIQCSIKTLNGIERFQRLQALSIEYMRSLTDISQLSHVSNSLRMLWINNCPKITNFDCLNDLDNLEHLALHGRNQLQNLAFLNKMKKLQTFTFSMTVADCDLTPCLQIPYAACLKSKREYNLKDKDLPKQESTKPFMLE